MYRRHEYIIHIYIVVKIKLSIQIVNIPFLAISCVPSDMLNDRGEGGGGIFRTIFFDKVFSLPYWEQIVIVHRSKDENI